MMAASAKDKQHFRAIAEGMARLEVESIAREQSLTPGQRIQAALRLTDVFLKSSQGATKPAPVSLSALWKQRHVHG